MKQKTFKQTIVAHGPFILLGILFFALRIPHLTREFTVEESHIVKSATAIAQTGYPLIYFGEQEPQVINLWKPPGLVFFMSVAFKFLGVSEVTARLVPLLFSFGQLLLLLFFAEHLWPKSLHKKLLALSAGLLFAIHPYTILNSFQVDIDGGVLAFFSTLFLFLALSKMLTKKTKTMDWILLAVVFFFSFSAKFEPSLIAAGIVLMFAVFARRTVLPKIILSITSAMAVFFGLFYLYNLSFGHPKAFFIPLQVIWQISSQQFFPKFTGLVAQNVTPSLWGGSFFVGIRFLSWLSIPTILLSFYCLVRFFQEKSYKKDVKLRFFLLFSVSFSLIYLVFGWAGDYPRYFAPVMPPLFLFISVITVHDFYRFKPYLSPKAVLAAVLASTVLLTLAYRANLLFLDRITGWIPSLHIPFGSILLIAMASILVFARFNKALMPALLIFLFLNLGQFTTQIIHDTTSTSSLTNFYGYSGYRDAGRFLKKELEGKDAVLFTLDPVAYYWGGKYYGYADLVPFEEKHPQLLRVLFSEEVTAIALPQIFIDELTQITRASDKDFHKHLSENFQEQKNFGGEKGIEIWY